MGGSSEGDVRALRDALRKMDDLAAAVAEGQIGKAKAWGGAGVGITRRPQKSNPDDFYPEPRWVVTPFVNELSWLFEQLWEGFRPLLDHVTKFEFFGRLGNAANRYHETAGPDASVRGLLNAVLAKAWSIAAEIASDAFEALPVAPDRAIAEDFIPPEDRT